MELKSGSGEKTLRYARIKVGYSFQNIPIAITSCDKPEINSELLEKWQKLIDLMAKITGVPSGLITKLTEDQLEVFLTNSNADNLFKPKNKFELGLGWYCETVAGTRKELLVTNALKSEEWKNNPSIAYNLISYMGMPILWPDGEVFGTFCILDTRENNFSEEHKELLKSLLEIIESDLRSTLLYEQTKSDIIQKELELREVHHCIKNQFNLLLSTIYIQQQNHPDNLELIISDIQARIKSISLLHDKLCHSVNMNELSLWDYLNELGKFILDTVTKEKINFKCFSDPLIICSRVSITCGLLLNELITNSVKHAFKGIPSPEIEVSIKRIDSGHISFIYKDNGTGIPEGKRLLNSNTLGTRFIEQEVKQLEGVYEIENNNGFEFRAVLKV